MTSRGDAATSTDAGDQTANATTTTMDGEKEEEEARRQYDEIGKKDTDSPMVQSRMPQDPFFS